MEEKVLKDVSKLVTVTTYAKKIGKTRSDVHYMIKTGKINFFEIDGVIFVDLSI